MTATVDEKNSRRDARTRCFWVPNEDELYVRYHDEEWGVPLHDERALFELLILEGFQAGLSWRTILHRRAGMREAFEGFDPEVMAEWGQARVAELLEDPRIIRNRLKVEGARASARAYLDLRAEGITFADHVWGFVDGRPLQNRFADPADVPAKTPAAEALGQDLKRRGFKFVGPTICYAFMQAAGMVNDHQVGCFRHAEVAKLG